MLAAQLKSFFMVARLGSFTQAARQLGLSQPTVTAQIRALEATYGAELFYRGGRRLALTDVGVRLMPMVSQLVSQENEIDFFLRNAGDMRGNLRVGATGPYYVLSIVDRFCQQHPAIEVEVVTGNSAQMLDALAEYRVDVASSSRHVDDARFQRVELVCDPLVLVVHERHPLATRDSVPVSALSTCRLLQRESGSVTREITERMLARAGISRASILELGSRESILEAIGLGMGVSVIASREVPKRSELRALSFADDQATVSEYLYCLQDRREARLIAAFLAEASLAYP
jgi:LysR family transcriptional regulator, low CO2-responsive transcriptional regulator